MKKNVPQALIIKCLTPFFVLLFVGQFIKAQPNILYFMEKVHQQDQLNPAAQPCCNGFYSLPGISGININVANTGFDYNDLIHLGTGTKADSLIIDLNNIKSLIKTNNDVVTDISLPIFGFGFWSGNSSFTFEVFNKTKLSVAYPKTILTLLDGNQDYIGENNPIIMNHLGPEMINYYEFAFGWSKKITHRLTIGAKFKLLSGLAAIQNKSSNLKVYTEFDTAFAMNVKTDLEFNVSAPVNYIYDAEGLIKDFSYDGFEVNQVLPTKNHGLGLDLGAIYQLSDRIKIHASVIDLGFISWNNNPIKLTQSGVFNFSGLSLDSVWSNSNYNELDALSDSISDFLRFENEAKKFKTPLNTTVYLGATYEVNRFLKLGILSKTYYYGSRLHQGFTLSANLKAGKNVSTSLAYSAMNREYKNIGMGLSLRLGPIQWYIASDNIYTAFMPKNSKSLNLMMGLNMVFGCNKRDNFSMLNDKNPDKSTDFM